MPHSFNSSTLAPDDDPARIVEHAANVIWRPVAALRPYAQNARRHSKQQIAQIAKSIERFGFTNPVLVSGDGEIIAGHGRVEAAKLLGKTEVPTLALAHLSAAERRAYVLADNKLALNAGWDQDMLAIEIQWLIDIEFDVELTGFELGEIELVLDGAVQRDTTPPVNPADDAHGDDAVPEPLPLPVTRLGDLWALGQHRLLCGDARSENSYARLLDGESVDLVFTDPPYNVPINGHVSGLGAVKHREFAFASGEMSEPEFTRFLTQSLGAMAAVCRDGAIAYVCMDWRHMGELLAAGRTVFTELKNLCVWNKSNGGMSTFYRSKHELVFVWKVGTAPHVNSFGLGDTGRYRTNVWDYAGISALSATRADELAMHPTVKPVTLIADALRDCSRRGDIILDGFGGSGSTLIAAHNTGRRARIIELDPGYCDTIIRRFEMLTGKSAILLGDDRAGAVDHDDLSRHGESAACASFEEIAEARGIALPERPPEPELRKRPPPSAKTRRASPRARRG